MEKMGGVIPDDIVHPFLLSESLLPHCSCASLIPEYIFTARWSNADKTWYKNKDFVDIALVLHRQTIMNHLQIWLVKVNFEFN